MGGWGAKVIRGGGGTQIPGNTPAPDPTKEVYGEISGVAKGIKTNILTFVAPAQIGGHPIIHLLYANFGGDNMAEYFLEINGSNTNRFTTYFGGDITGFWDFRNPSGGGKAVDSADIIRIRVEHCRPDDGAFWARLCYIEIN